MRLHDRTVRWIKIFIITENGDEDEIFPWDIIDIGVSEDSFCAESMKNAKQGRSDAELHA